MHSWVPLHMEEKLSTTPLQVKVEAVASEAGTRWDSLFTPHMRYSLLKKRKKSKRKRKETRCEMTGLMCDAFTNDTGLM